jgi:hypothetical protein
MKRSGFNDRDCQTHVRHLLDKLENGNSNSETLAWGILVTDKCPSLPAITPLRENAEEYLNTLSKDLPDRIRSGKTEEVDERYAKQFVERYEAFILQDIRSSLNWETWLRYKTRTAYKDHIGTVDAVLSGGLIWLAGVSMGYTRPQATIGAIAAAFTSATQLPKRIRKFFTERV